MIGPVINPGRRVSESAKQLNADDQNLQRDLQKEVCGNLYLERYPTGNAGTLEPLYGNRCKLTGKDCVADKGYLGVVQLLFTKGSGARQGLDVKVAERCPSRKLE